MVKDQGIKLSSFLNNNIDFKTMSPLTLAFVGDGIYELLVREYIVGKGNCPVKKLHAAKVDMVRCEFQAKITREVLIHAFSDEEMEIYMRGRNAHVGHVPKNSDVADYHAATAFEAVFGYLYLKGETGRLNELFMMVVNSL